MNIDEHKILIVEDERSTRNYLIRRLFDLNIKGEHIEAVSNLSDAKDKLESFNPTIVLLDLSIPDREGEGPEINNSFQVLEKIQSINVNRVNKTKVIVISATIFDNALKKIIALSDKLIFKYLDKSGIAEDSNAFNMELQSVLNDVISEKNEDISIDYKFIREGEMIKLKNVDSELWNEVNKNILQEFNKIYVLKSNESIIPANIIRSCGSIVEMIIERFKLSPISHIQKMNLKREKKTYRKLIILSGREFVSGNRYSKLGNEYISRASAKYASLVYELRNELSHRGEMQGTENNKLFEGAEPSIEDAAISMNLIVPLIHDYIAFKKGLDSSKNQTNYSPGKR